MSLIHHVMSENTVILVPIRYPLTDESSRTLAMAGRLAEERRPAEVRVLHVNLLQYNGDVQTVELTRAISSVLDGVEASVTTRRGFLVEEVILEEAAGAGADVIVVGTDRDTLWRRLVRRLIGNEPRIGAYLDENAPRGTDVVEVDTATDTPATDVAT